MATSEIHTTVRTVTSILPQTLTADANGTSVDTRGFEAVEFVFHVGNSADTLSGSVYIELECEHSTDDSTWTDCANADLTNTVTGTNTGTLAKIDAPTEDSLVVRAGYIGANRYVRPVWNITGTHSNGCPGSAMVLLGKPRSAAVANP